MKLQSTMRITYFYFFLVLLFWGACQSASENQQAKQPTIAETTATKERTAQIDRSDSPEVLYGELFQQVQLQQVFPDGKTFVDCTPKMAPEKIMADYEKAKNASDFDLKKFVEAHFKEPVEYASGFVTDPNRSTAEHVNALWPVLTRQPDAQQKGTLIPLPKPYIVPGGRFREIYYWDSYFTILGLQSAGKVDMIENMVDNFAHLLKKVGFIPNGNRTYFLTRSQPPFFARMVQVLAEEKGEEVYKKYLPALETEYDFWMNGRNKVSESSPTFQKIVRLPDGQILNRYWDMGDYPRAESYREDVETAEESQRPASQVYRDIRAACESGWDFSSRWFKDPNKLSSIHTTEIIPVDLNALLFNLENTLAMAYRQNGENGKAQEVEDMASRRKAALLKYCWDESRGYFMDYDFVEGQVTDVPSLAGIFPLAFQMATEEQAQKSAEMIEKYFLKPGGVVSTLNHNGQQWDAPNGWAPLQWMTIEGLRNYGKNDLANTIKKRWLDLNEKVYQNTGKMVEKYNVEDMSLEAGGGEYPVQDGFGWSNGVYLHLSEEG